MGATHSLIENLTYDELAPGQTARMQRTITGDDVKAFALVSGDVNPAHVDVEYAEGTRFHGVIVHGMFAGALISSLLGTEFPGPGTIYIEQSLRFHRPVHIGDTLEVAVTVLDKDDASGNVRLDCDVRNQHADQVVSGQALVKAPRKKVARPRASMPALHLFDPRARLEDWLAGLETPVPVPCAVVHPCDEPSLRGALDAAGRGFIRPVLIGPVSRIRAVADAAGLDLKGMEILDAPHSHAAAEIAVSRAVSGEVGMLFKGSLPTEELMGAVLARPQLRTGRRMSHVFRCEIPAYAKPLLVTDAAINIRPSLDEKADIVRNAIDVAHRLGIARPAVALLAALETITSRLPSTLDAAALCKMAERGQIRGAVLDGPLAFDNAISMDAARLKSLGGPVAGNADILVVPDLESGTILAKQLEYLAGAARCGVVVGARVPIALTDRADTPLTRMASVALAGLLAPQGRPGPTESETGREFS